MEREQEARECVEAIVDYIIDREDKTREFVDSIKESMKDKPIDTELIDRLEAFVKKSAEQQDKAKKALDKLQSMTNF